jgi:hypothetical protein
MGTWSGVRSYWRPLRTTAHYANVRNRNNCYFYFGLIVCDWFDIGLYQEIT